jgi:hypothetical protein
MEAIRADMLAPWLFGVQLARATTPARNNNDSANST